MTLASCVLVVEEKVSFENKAYLTVASSYDEIEEKFEPVFAAEPMLIFDWQVWRESKCDLGRKRRSNAKRSRW